MSESLTGCGGAQTGLLPSGGGKSAESVKGPVRGSTQEHSGIHSMFDK